MKVRVNSGVNPVRTSQAAKPHVAQTVQLKAPPVYRPVPQTPAAPPVYRPQQIANRAAQLKQANDLRLEKRPAPPVYRPQPVSSHLQGKVMPGAQGPGLQRGPIIPDSRSTTITGLQRQSATQVPDAPPIYKPPSPASTQTPSSPAVLQPKKGNPNKKKKQEEQKKRTQSKEQSQRDRNINKVRKYQTPKKKIEDQQNLEEGIGKLKKNFAHGTGGKGSPMSGTTKNYLKSLNQEGNKKKKKKKKNQIYVPSEHPNKQFRKDFDDDNNNGGNGGNNQNFGLIEVN